MNDAAQTGKPAPYPLRFRPVYKDYLWGGDGIFRHYGRQKTPSVCAESWEVSVRPGDESIVAGGPLTGTSLTKIVPEFPLLLKILDAAKTLSVQVHPDDQSAVRFGGEAKTEMWYVLAADPDAHVFCGLKPGTDETKLRAALANKTVADLLRKIPVVAGDAVFVPGGRVHAIGAGCLLLECQQNSNTTYRLYDWDRIGPDGKPRPLHIEDSLRVINWNDTAPARIASSPLPCPAPNRRALVLDTKYFRMERFDLFARIALDPIVRDFEIIFIAEGALEIRAPEFSETAAAGTTFLLPHGLSGLELVPKTTSIVLRITA